MFYDILHIIEVQLSIIYRENTEKETFDLNKMELFAII